MTTTADRIADRWAAATEEPEPRRFDDGILLSLDAHRLLTTRQLNRLVMPDATESWTCRVLKRLESDGVIAHAKGPGRNGKLAWFLTSSGYASTTGAGTVTRRYRTNAQKAAGPLRRHTLATNEAGLAFVTHARSRGLRADSWTWTNEVAFGRGAGAPCADAVVHDPATPGNAVAIELDRATKNPADVAAQLGRYGDSEAVWRSNVHTLLLVFDMADERAASNRYLDIRYAMWKRRVSMGLHSWNVVAVRVCLLSVLTEFGPWEPIFRDLPDCGEQIHQTWDDRFSDYLGKSRQERFTTGQADGQTGGQPASAPPSPTAA